jgi:transposase-like protein
MPLNLGQRIKKRVCPKCGSYLTRVYGVFRCSTFGCDHTEHDKVVDLYLQRKKNSVKDGVQERDGEHETEGV